MRRFQTLVTSRLVIWGVLVFSAAWPLMSAAQDQSDKARGLTSHAQQKDKQPFGDQDLASQIAELHAKVEKLEAAMKQNSIGTPSDMPEQGSQADRPDKMVVDPPSTRVSVKYQNCLECHQSRPGGPLPASHLAMAGSNDKRTEKDVASDGTEEPSHANGSMNVEDRLLKKIDKMIGMMEKMMGSGVMQPANRMPVADGKKMMEDDMDEMSPMQSNNDATDTGGKGISSGAASSSNADGGMMKKMDKMMGMMEKMMDGGAMPPAQGMPAALGVGGNASPTNVENRLMKKMDKMMGMMEKMMDSGAMPPAQGMPAAGGMQDM